MSRGALRSGLWVVVLAWGLSGAVRADYSTNTFTWTGAGGNSLWSNPANWSPAEGEGIYPHGTNHFTVFPAVDNALRTVTVDLDVILNQIDITIGSGTGYVFNASANETLTFVKDPAREKIYTSTGGPGVEFNIDVDIPASSGRLRPPTGVGMDMVFNRNLTGTRLQMMNEDGRLLVRGELGRVWFSQSGILTLYTDEGVNRTYGEEMYSSAGRTPQVIKAGPGTAIFTGLKTYAGSTRINEGRLDANTTITNCLFTVAGGGLLAGTGWVGPTTVENNGRLGAGSGANTGTLTLHSLVLEDEARLALRLGAPGDPHDQLHVAGDLTLDGWLDVTDLGGFDEGTYTLMTYDGTLTDLGLQTGAMPGGFAYQIDTATVGEVKLTVIPEPGTLLLLLGAAGGILCVRRRRSVQPALR